MSQRPAIVGAIIGWNLFSGSITDSQTLVKIVATWVAGPVLAGLIADELAVEEIDLRPDAELTALIAYLQRLGRGPQPVAPELERYVTDRTLAGLFSRLGAEEAKIREDPATGLLPVVMVTALDPGEERVKGIEAGADDVMALDAESF